MKSEGGKSIDVKYDSIVGIEMRDQMLIVFVKEEIDKFNLEVRNSKDDL